MRSTNEEGGAQMRYFKGVEVVLCSLSNLVVQWMSAAVGLEQYHIIGLDCKYSSIRIRQQVRTDLFPTSRLTGLRNDSRYSD